MAITRDKQVTSRSPIKSSQRGSSRLERIRSPPVRWHHLRPWLSSTAAQAFLTTNSRLGVSLRLLLRLFSHGWCVPTGWSCEASWLVSNLHPALHPALCTWLLQPWACLLTSCVLGEGLCVTHGWADCLFYNSTQRPLDEHALVCSHLLSPRLCTDWQAHIFNSSQLLFPCS